MTDTKQDTAQLAREFVEECDKLLTDNGKTPIGWTLDDKGEAKPFYSILDASIRGDFPLSAERRRVSRDLVDGLIVSTVFLGIDHSFGDGPPLLWETMVFNCKDPNDLDDIGVDLYCDRYSTRAAAVEGHAKVVARIRTHPDEFTTEDGTIGPVAATVEGEAP